jgi:hypothetical protein
MAVWACSGSQDLARIRRNQPSGRPQHGKSGSRCNFVAFRSLVSETTARVDLPNIHDYIFCHVCKSLTGLQQLLLTTHLPVVAVDSATRYLSLLLFTNVLSAQPGVSCQRDVFRARNNENCQLMLTITISRTVLRKLFSDHRWPGRRLDNVHWARCVSTFKYLIP